MRCSRRGFLRSTLAAGAAAAVTGPQPRWAAAAEGDFPPIRPITRPPGFHWFSYYDKLQFDPTGRYCLGMRVEFEHRSPRPDDEIRLGMIDLEEGDRWIELGASRAWGWQQGCMLQWLPGSATEVLWNDREGDRFVCRIFDTATRGARVVPAPIYSVSPDGRTAVAPDFRRIQDTRPGYGYAGLPDPHADERAPRDSGIFRIDLASGRAELIVSMAEVARLPYPHGDLSQAKHWFNHLLVSPDGERFIFLHRWRHGEERGFGTRMFTAAMDGSDLRVVDHSGYTSHFIWRDPQHILAWTRHPSHGDAFYLFEDRAGGRVEVVGKGVMTVNGHCTYLPGIEWILNDTYPQGPGRLQKPYLYHVAEGRRVPLGEFHLPPQYAGEWRCDLHPRFSPDGSKVTIDSPHEGNGRQIYLIDIGAIVG